MRHGCCARSPTNAAFRRPRFSRAPAIAPVDLDNPEALVAASDEIAAVRRLLRLLPDTAGLGIDVGSRFRLTHLGLFGFAVMSCATLRELFDVSMRYFSLTMLNIDVKLFEGADTCLLELNVDHLPEDVREFFLERDVAGIVITVSDFALPVLAAIRRSGGRRSEARQGSARTRFSSCCRSRISSSVVRTTGCTFRERCSTSHCRRRTATPCRCASPSATC